MTIANSLTITGKLGAFVYQRTAPGLGNVPGDTTGRLQVRAYVAHNHSKTPAQLACRERFRAAMQAWRALTPEQCTAYADRASRAGVAPMNYFISLQMMS